MTALTLSIVTPTYQRAANLRLLLDSLAEQTLSSELFEVIVIDDGSADDTLDVIRSAASKLPNLAWESGTNAGPARARNRGASRATGDVIVFLDDDIEAAPDLLAKHHEFHTGRGDDHWGLLGRVDWAPTVKVTPFMRWIDRMGLQFSYDTWLEEGEVPKPYRAFYMANISIPRAAFVASGGFDERFPYPAFEDYELGWRLVEAGFRVHYDPAARAFHTRGIDIRTFRRRMKMVGESAQFLLALHPRFELAEVLTKNRLDRRRRLKHLEYAPIARLVGDQARLDRVYREVIADAYCEGKRLGIERLAAAGAPRSDTLPET